MQQKGNTAARTLLSVLKSSSRIRKEPQANSGCRQLHKKKPCMQWSMKDQAEILQDKAHHSVVNLRDHQDLLREFGGMVEESKRELTRTKTSSGMHNHLFHNKNLSRINPQIIHFHHKINNTTTGVDLEIGIHYNPSISSSKV